jgi:DNA invertase Pin-like site-specific DNA recombinase
MKRAVLYLRVSTQDQTTSNQERELREIAGRMGCEITHVYKDHGISGAKGRDKRPAFDRLCRDAAKRQFDVGEAQRLARAAGPGKKSRLKLTPTPYVPQRQRTQKMAGGGGLTQ